MIAVDGTVTNRTGYDIQAAPPGAWRDVDPANRGAPTSDTRIDREIWNGVPVTDGIHVHDFTYVAEYPSPAEAEAIFGRLYGPVAAAYLRDWHLRTVTSRLRIQRAQVAK